MRGHQIVISLSAPEIRIIGFNDLHKKEEGGTRNIEWECAARS